MKKKFILPRRFFAFALAFAMTFTSFPPLSVHAEGDEEMVQETVIEEEHCDDCCNHEAEDAATQDAAEETFGQTEQAPTETPVIEETLPQVEVIPEDQTEVSLVEEIPTVLEAPVMMLFGAKVCKHSSMYNTGEKKVIKPATCKEPGIGAEVWNCHSCGNNEVYKNEYEIPVTNHTFVDKPGKPSTCRTKGYTDYKECSVCGAVEGKTELGLDPNNHSYIDVDEKLPTCTENGWCAHKKCSECGVEYGKVELPAAHAWEYVTITPATCQQREICKEVCKICHDEGRTNVQVGFKTSHKKVVKDTKTIYGASCRVEGKQLVTYECEYCHMDMGSEEVPIPKEEHTPVNVNEEEPSCNHPGYTAGTRCSVCDVILSGCEEIPMVDHQWDEVERLVPTCTKDGYVYKVCKVCHQEDKEDLKAIGHKMETIPAVEPTCYGMGHSAFEECSQCHYRPVEPTWTSPLGGPHVWVFDHVITNPTCGKKGTAEYKCSTCGEKTTRDVSPTGNHTWGENYDDVYDEPTCTSPGEKNICHKCTECGYEEIVKHYVHIDNLPHTYGEPVIKKATDCKHYDQEVKVCTVCGYKLTTTCIDASGKDIKGPHNYQFDYYSVTPTCTKSGYAWYKCSTCFDSYSEVAPATDHDYSEEKVTIKEPKCFEDGLKGRVCSKCSDATDVETIPMTGEHTWGTYKPDGNANCQSVGTKTAHCTCPGCSATDTITGDALGDHVWASDYTVDKEATCQEEGSKSKHCTLCDEKGFVTKIDKAKHNLEWVVVVEPTCTEQGKKVQKCQNPGCSYETNETPMGAKGHDWATNYTVDTEPTCLNYGWESRHCSRCEAWTDQKRIEKIPHDDEFLYETEPSCELEARKYFKCKVCETRHSEKIADKLGHDFKWVTIKEATCTEDGSRKQVCQREDCSAYTAPETIPAPGHQFGEWYVAEEATCQNAGLKRRDCANCSHYETEVIPKEENHKYVVSEKVAPTCTEQGYDLALCKWCNKERHQHLVDPLGHDFSVVSKVVKPTCLKDGYTVYKCARCEETENRDTVSALGHDYGEWKVTKEPTCKDLGSKRRDCIHEGCNSYQTQAIPVVKHSFTEVKEVVEPTCLEKGYTVYKCKWCDETEIRDYVDALDHDYEEEWQVETPATCEENGTQIKHCRRPGCTWVTRTVIFKTGHNYEEEWKVIKEPTCQELGIQARYCQNEGCNRYLSNAINKVGHSFTVPQKTVNPTCTEQGYTVYKCKWCEETETRDYIDALDHDFEEEWQVETPATCEENGTQIKHCRRPGCTWVTRTVIFKTGHNYEEEWKVIKEPTCQELGIQARYCQNEGCNRYLSNAINKVGHSFTVPQKTVNPTCTEKGYTVYKCKWCEETEIRDYVDPLDHDYGEWFTVTDATCQADGEERHNCKNCEAYETRPITKLDHHVFSEFVKKVEPTCIDDGYTTYKCTWCEETENRDIVKAEGHKYGEWYTVTDPTCQAEGEARRDCKNCEHFETKPIEKVDHAYNKFVKAVAPTCESKGYSVYKCQWCEKTETRDYVDALGHKHVTDPGKSATCTSDGYTEKEYCSRCGKVFRERETTKATGHNWGPEQFENIVFPTTISVGGYDSVRYCWNCGCKHSVHVTLPMITLKPVAPIKPLPSVPTLPISPKAPVKPAQPDDPMDIIDRSEEQKADDIAESPEDVKDKEDADSSKSEEVVDDKSNETSEQIVTDNGKDDQKKSEIKSQDPKDNETGEDVDTDYSTYFIIAFGILLLIILITLFIILMSKRKNDEEDGELK